MFSPVRSPSFFEPMGLIYLLPCSNCNWSYVAETSRTLKERLSEHRRSVRNFSTRSEVANHVHQTGHLMNWDAARILGREGQHFRRIIKEAWFTRSHSSGNSVLRSRSRLEPYFEVILAPCVDFSCLSLLFLPFSLVCPFVLSLCLSFITYH